MRVAVICLAALALCGCGPAPRVHTGTAPKYRLERLTDLEEALALDNAGVVAGRARTGNLVLWKDGKTRRIPGIEPGYHQRCAMNAAGDILIDMAARTEGGPTHAFLVRNGEAIDLGTLGGETCRSADLNDAGQAALTCETHVGRPTERACRWSDRRLAALPPSDRSARAEAINARGDVAGAITQRGGATRAAVWPGSRATDLGTLGGTESGAVDINDAGVVVGWSGLSAESSRVHAVMWRDGRCIDLTSAGSPNSRAVGINNRGQVVGVIETADDEAPRAFLYHDGRMVDLGSAISGGSGWVVTLPRAINDRGQVLAVGVRGASRGPVLLTPLP